MRFIAISYKGTKYRALVTKHVTLKRKHTHTDTRVRICTHARTHAHTHTHIHALSNTNTHTLLYNTHSLHQAESALALPRPPASIKSDASLTAQMLRP